MTIKVEFVREWQDNGGNAYRIGQIVDLENDAANRAKDGGFAIDWVGMTSDEPTVATSSS